MKLISDIKLIPPKIPSQIISRPRLFVRLRYAIKKKATLLIASGGWGKSVLLSSFLEVYNQPSVWYNLDRDDSDPGVFLIHIAEGIRRQCHNVGQQTLEIIKKMQGGFQWQPVVTTLCNEILDYMSDRIIIVLDDYHRLDESSPIKDIFDYLLRHCPPNVHIIISSRVKPKLKLSRLLTYGELHEIGIEDLRFDKDEIAHFFGALYNIDLSEQDLDIIQDYTEGWVLGLRLLAESISKKKLKEVIPFISGLRGSKIPVYDYFYEELFQSLTAEEKFFLEVTSILNRFSREIYSYMTGRDGDEIIEQLMKRQLFILGLDKEGKWYRYHHIFQEFLQECLKKEAVGGFIAELHRKAASFFQDTGNWEEAVLHSIEAQDYKMTAKVLESGSNYFFVPSAGGTLGHLLEKIPSEVISSNAALLLAKGLSFAVTGDNQRSFAMLTEARSIAIKENNQSILAEATSLLLNTYHLLEEYEQVHKLSEETLPFLESNSLQKITINMFYVGAQIFLNKQEKASQGWDKLLNNPVTKQNKLLYYTFTSIKAYTYCLQTGNFKEAAASLREGIDFLKVNNIGLYATFLNTFGWVKNETGDFKESQEILNQSIDFLKQMKQFYLLNSAFSMIAINAVCLNNMDHARKAIQENKAIRPKIEGHKHNKEHLFKIALALVAFHENDMKSFYQFADEAIKLVNKSNIYFDIYQGACWLAPCYAFLGDKKLSKELLQRSTKVIRVLGNRYGEARTFLLLASVHYDEGDRSTAKDYLYKSLSLCIEGEYEFLFTRKERPHSLKLLPFALTEKLYLPYVASLMIKMSKGCAQNVLPLLKHNDPEVRVAAIEILSTLKYREAEKSIIELMKDPFPQVKKSVSEAIKILQSLPPEPLKVHALGRFQLFVGKSKIPQAAWKRKIASSLFKYLLFNAVTGTSTDRLIELFCPDKDIETGIESIRQGVSTLRKVLEPHIPMRKESSYLKVIDGTYRFVLPEDSYVDVFEFENLMTRASTAVRESNISGAISLYKSAISIYKGDFLEEDIYEDWTFHLRERFSTLYLKALKELSHFYFKTSEYDQSLEVLEKLLQKDDCDEDAYLLKMKNYIALGQRHKAIQVYRDGAKRIKEDLDVEPCLKLREFYSNICVP